MQISQIKSTVAFAFKSGKACCFGVGGGLQGAEAPGGAGLADLAAGGAQGAAPAALPAGVAQRGALRPPSAGGCRSPVSVGVGRDPSHFQGKREGPGPASMTSRLGGLLTMIPLVCGIFEYYAAARGFKSKTSLPHVVCFLL